MITQIKERFLRIHIEVLIILKRKNYILCFFFLLYIANYLSAQDSHFTQFYANPLYLNPAFAGSVNCPRIGMNYRNQWPALSGTFVTYSLSYDQYIQSLLGGIGFLVMADRAGKGTLNTTQISGIYSYSAALNRHLSVKMGFQATYMQKTIDWEKLTFGDMIDERLGFIYGTHETPTQVSVNLADFSTGILLYSSKLYAGLATHHLFQPDEGFIGISTLPRKYTAHIGATLLLNERDKKQGTISPNLLIQLQQDFKQINAGLYFSKGIVVMGAWYRYSDAIILLLGIKAQQLRLGYSYDITISKLRNASAGSHEISMILQLPCSSVKKPSTKPIDCPTNF